MSKPRPAIENDIREYFDTNFPRRDDKIAAREAAQADLIRELARRFRDFHEGLNEHPPSQIS